MYLGHRNGQAVPIVTFRTRQHHGCGDVTSNGSRLDGFGKVIWALGRRPNTGGIGLEAAGVGMRANGIVPMRHALSDHGVPTALWTPVLPTGMSAERRRAAAVVINLTLAMHRCFVYKYFLILIRIRSVPRFRSSNMKQITTIFLLVAGLAGFTTATATENAQPSDTTPQGTTVVESLDDTSLAEDICWVAPEWRID